MELANDTVYTQCPLEQRKIVDESKSTSRCQPTDNDSLRLAIKQLKLNPECVTLKDLIDALYKIFDKDEVNIEEVYALMTAYKSNPAEWLKYAKFDRFR